MWQHGTPHSLIHTSHRENREVELKEYKRQAGLSKEAIEDTQVPVFYISYIQCFTSRVYGIAKRMRVMFTQLVPPRSCWVPPLPFFFIGLTWSPLPGSGPPDLV